MQERAPSVPLPGVSTPLLTRLLRNARWSLLAPFYGVRCDPARVDCPDTVDLSLAGIEPAGIVSQCAVQAPVRPDVRESPSCFNGSRQIVAQRDIFRLGDDHRISGMHLQGLYRLSRGAGLQAKQQASKHHSICQHLDLHF